MIWSSRDLRPFGASRRGETYHGLIFLPEILS